MKLQPLHTSMIGNHLENQSWNMVLGTQHCPHRCHRRAVPLCQMQPMESNHLVDTCPLRKSKKGPLKQIVPQYQTLKNNYTLLWDMPDNTGYINIVAVMQKFFDQAISGNWSYNPSHYEDNEVPTIGYGSRPPSNI
jgi:hypothetical protein